MNPFIQGDVRILKDRSDCDRKLLFAGRTFIQTFANFHHRIGGNLVNLRRIATRADRAIRPTQEQIIERLKSEDEALYPASISQYEKGKREPSLLVLLRYARLIGVSMETLVDDELNLPKRTNR